MPGGDRPSLPFLIAEAGSSITVQAINHRRLALFPPDLLLEVALPNVRLLFGDNGNRAIIETGRRAALDQRARLAVLQKPLPGPWRRRLGATARRLHRAWAAMAE